MRDRKKEHSIDKKVNIGLAPMHVLDLYHAYIAFGHKLDLHPCTNWICTLTHVVLFFNVFFLSN